MPARLSVAVLALAGLTAFAPAPFPRKHNKAKADPALLLAGLWKVEKVARSTSRGYTTSTSLMSHIRIQDGRWTFMRNNRGTVTPSTSYRLVIHSDQTPIALDGMRDNSRTPWMLGIARRVGDTVEVLYGFGVKRPDSFERPPTDCWRITLRREKETNRP
jgi:hypothetical protein